MSVSLMVASADEHFRETVREGLLNVANGKVVAEFPDVSANLYIRVTQELERHPEAALLVDLAADNEAALKAVEKVKQAIPDLYIVASNFHADGDSVIAAVRAGASDFLLQPLKRSEFREAMDRIARAPRRALNLASGLGKMYTFLGVKGGVGATTLAVNFASVLAQRKQNTVLVDLDFMANDVAMQLGAAPQHTLAEVAENLNRLDLALFEGFVARDPLGFFFVGPPEALENRIYFTDAMFRDLSTFLIEKYQSIVVDAGKAIADDLVYAALQSSATVFLVLTQEFPAIRNAQRYISFLMRMGFNQDQLKVVVNRYQKKPATGLATLDQIQQTLNQPVFYGIPPSPAVLESINKSRPFVADRQAAGELDRVFRAFVDKATGEKPALAKSA